MLAVAMALYIITLLISSGKTKWVWGGGVERLFTFSYGLQPISSINTLWDPVISFPLRILKLVIINFASS